MKLIGNILGVLLMIGIMTTSASGQGCGPGGTGITIALEKADKLVILDSLYAQIREFYVFPEKADKVISTIKGNMANGKYDRYFKANDFGTAITNDLRSITNDLHFGMKIIPTIATQPMASCGGSPLEVPEALRTDNMGFQSVKILAGNIGYIKVDSFVDSDLAGPVADAAMQFLNGTDAIIVDLRNCLGGRESMIGALAGYFLKPGTELHTMKTKPGEKDDLVAAIRPQNGLTFLDTPLLILTSPSTASAAEAFAYDLKHLGRATVIGEKTMGAGHCASLIDIEFPQFIAEFELPIGIPVNPVTNSNWENVGVTPDIKIDAGQALAEAHKQAFLKMASKTNDPAKKWAYQWTSMTIKSQYYKYDLSPGKLSEYIGTYGPRIISQKGKDLIYARDINQQVYRLIPIDNDIFALEGIDIMRLRFDRDQSGNIVGLTGIYNQGNQDGYPKN